MGVLDEKGLDGIAFADLSNAIQRKLSDRDLSNLGSLGWHVTTIKLEPEVNGEIAKISGVSPQRLCLAIPHKSLK